MRIIAGSRKGRKIAAPANNIRPTQSVVREAIFNILDIEGKSFLDLFAGSGAVGIEALSRGAEYASFVEKTQQGVKIISENINEMGFNDSTDVYMKDAEKFMRSTEKKYDVIFADPPYYEGHYQKVFDVLSERTILNDEGILLMELEKKSKELNTLKERAFKEKKYGKSILLLFSKEDICQ